MSQIMSDGPLRERKTTTKVWSCKIGEVTAGELEDATSGLSSGDQHMRDAVEHAYRTLFGIDRNFIFSGWGGELTEAERAVVEDRTPVFFLTGYLEKRLHDVREVLRAGDELPDWTPEQWASTLAIKLGRACETLHDSPEIRQGEDQLDRDMRHDVATEQLLALAAGALDAIEALGERWAREDTREHGGMTDAQ